MIRLVSKNRPMLIVLATMLVAACAPSGAAPSATPQPTVAATATSTGATFSATPEPTVAATATSSPTPDPTPTHSPNTSPTPSRDPEAIGDGEAWLSFQQFPGGKSTITLARLDGSGLHSPTRHVPGGEQTNADWSPDGRTLVFGVAIDGRDDLWTVGADGTGERQLADCEAPCSWLDDPAWSPDGRYVLFSRNIEVDGVLSGTLERIDVATGVVEIIARAPEGYFYAGQRWSPDGAAVVLEVVEFTESGDSFEVVDVALAVMELANPTPLGRALTEPGTFPEAAAWSPAGDRIVFGALPATGAASTDLFSIDPDGTSLKRVTHLTADGGLATHPEISADGSWVVFAAMVPGHTTTVLAAVDIQGGDVRPALGNSYVEGVHPRLRPVPPT